LKLAENVCISYVKFITVSSGCHGASTSDPWCLTRIGSDCLSSVLLHISGRCQKERGDLTAISRRRSIRTR